MRHASRSATRQTPVPRAKPEHQAAYLEALRFLKRKGISGIAFGIPYKSGTRLDDERAIVIHVHRKVPMSEIPAGQILPKTVAGLRVDVIERSFHAPNFVGQFKQVGSPALITGNRTIRPGIGIKTKHGLKGSVGPIVRDEEGRLCFLTAAHVVAGPIGTPIFTAGLGGGDFIGTKLKEEFGIDGDGALCLLADGWQVDGIPITLTRAPDAIGNALIRDLLWKFGEGTSATEGEVENVGRFPIDYGENLGIRTMSCLSIKRPAHVFRGEISSLSDSGAMWIDRERNLAVGLNIAGEKKDSPREYALACSLSELLRALSASYPP